MIDQDTVQRIIERAEIVEVVQEFVSLKRKGTNYTGLCPFHDEKTPSFIVSPAKGIFKCFGCGKGGNSVNFVMEIEHLSYPDALRFLAKKFHVEVEEREQTPEQLQQKNERESIMIVNGFAKDFFKHNLFHTDEGRSVGLSYFRERGFRDDIIDKFELGYSAERFDDLTVNAIKKGYKTEYLDMSGLTIEKNGNRFDRFHGRVMFPVHSLAGRVIAFGGRILKADKKTAKYLNSPESVVYHKSDILYGLFFAKTAIIRQDNCFMVEGYTDVLSLQQAGIENVVASSGTSLTVSQIRLVKRFTNNLTVIYDGDKAGIKASIRGIDMILEEGMNVKVVPLPEPEDPDSFSKNKTTAELLAYIDANKQDFIKFKAALLLEEAKNDPIKKAQLLNDIVGTIAVIPNTMTRTVYIKECFTILGIGEDIITTEVNKRRFEKADKEFQINQRHEEQIKTQVQAAKATGIEENYYEPYEREICRVLINYANEQLKLTIEDEEVHLSVGEFIISEIECEEFDFFTNSYRKIFAEFSHFYKESIAIDQKYFLNHTDIEICKAAVDLASTPHTLSKLWTKDFIIDTREIDINIAVPAMILKYKLIRLKITVNEIVEAIKAAEKDKDFPKVIELINKKKIFDKLKSDIAKEIGDDIIIL